MLFTEAQKAFKKHLIYKDSSDETVNGYMRDLRCLNRFLTNTYNTAIYIDLHIKMIMQKLKTSPSLVNKPIL